MKSDGYFPLFIDISEKKIVVVGGGNIAARRVKTLSGFSSRITVVAPEIHPDLEQLEREGKIAVIRREYRREDIYDAWMVLAATDQHKLNEEIYSVAKCLGALVNVASNQTKCDFHFPGIVRKDSYVVGINASGKDHRGAAVLRGRIAEMLETFEVPETMEAAEVPEIKEIPEAKEILKAKEIPETKEISKAKEIPEVKEILKAKEIPEAKEIPKAKEISKASELSAAQERSGD